MEPAEGLRTGISIMRAAAYPAGLSSSEGGSGGSPEMFQYREVLVRLHQGETDREIARSGRMGRRKVAAFRYLCEHQGWLDPAAPLPEDAALAAALGPPKRAGSTISSVEPYRAVVQRWVEQGVNAVAIHAALSRSTATEAAIPRCTAW